jgi:hypothetical protein
MKELMKYTYMLDLENIDKELGMLWNRYTKILDKNDASWEEMNEARAILYLTGQIYCEEIAVGAIERRLHLLKNKLSLVEFFNLIDSNSEKLAELRDDELFAKLEKFYKIVKKYKNNYVSGKYYLDEEKFIEKHEGINPDKDLKMGYKGKFGED